MAKNKLMAVLLLIAAFVSIVLDFVWIIPINRMLGYAIGVIDAIILVGLAFYLWFKPSTT
jgi:hypothetical protein